MSDVELLTKKLIQYGLGVWDAQEIAEKLVNGVITLPDSVPQIARLKRELADTKKALATANADCFKTLQERDTARDGLAAEVNRRSNDVEAAIEELL